MKIGHPADKPLPAPAVGAPAAQAEAAKPASAHATGAAGVDASATVALSSTASTLLSTGGAGEFDAGKVANITGQIADGSFKVNPEAIADKLIANAQELLSKVGG
ncbi:MAG TPA: flagellar biosynthesis anti-sigma factor FlgM [Caldimonas sp.]|jgi:negative regulator of flagellin synthesis FlgM|nr:flagellar biosynthesis anti-sigma factor FlgM [Caldimonas sp.]HEX4234486.1 flagellar biosynthesis anti-sigma factor FlgM [Caldimonas sp.]